VHFTDRVLKGVDQADEATQQGELRRALALFCLEKDKDVLGEVYRSLMAKRLLKKGAWFSFSGHFLHPRKSKVQEVFRKLPEDRILLETDAPDMIPPGEFVGFLLLEGINHPANLRRIAEAFERETRVGMLGRITENGKRFWGF
jgi:hypothetical protein